MDHFPVRGPETEMESAQRQLANLDAGYAALLERIEALEAYVIRE